MLRPHRLTLAVTAALVFPTAAFAQQAPADTQARTSTLDTLIVTGTRVSDRTDGKIAHLDGLNLSRGWCWRAIAAALPASEPLKAVAADAAQRHLDAALPHVTGDCMGEHWLASFALLALHDPDVSASTRSSAQDHLRSPRVR